MHAVLRQVETLLYDLVVGFQGRVLVGPEVIQVIRHREVQVQGFPAPYDGESPGLFRGLRGHVPGNLP